MAGKGASKGSQRPSNRALTAPIQSGQRRANAIDSIVNIAQKGGAERQSGQHKKNR
jgi:hypothetical protein